MQYRQKTCCTKSTGIGTELALLSGAGILKVMKKGHLRPSENTAPVKREKQGFRKSVSISCELSC